MLASFVVVIILPVPIAMGFQMVLLLQISVVRAIQIHPIIVFKIVPGPGVVGQPLTVAASVVVTILPALIAQGFRTDRHFWINAISVIPIRATIALKIAMVFGVERL